MSRNEHNFGRVRAMARDLAGKGTVLAEAFRSRGLDADASKVDLLDKRISNVIALADKLGSSSAGKDAANLTKIDAEWKIVRRLADNLNGPIAVRDALMSFREEAQLLEDYLLRLKG